MKKAARKKFPSPVSLTYQQPANGVEEDRKLDAVLSAIGLQSTTNDWMCVLNLLEKRTDEKMMCFIKWMRSNGKLQQIMSAYNLAVRVSARKEDWDMANMLIPEIISGSDCRINSQVFNP